MQLPEILPTELDKRMRDGDSLLLIDVRQHEELAIANLPNSFHFPMMELDSRLDELRSLVAERGNPDVVVYCRVGGRSATVVEYLSSVGFERIYNLSGGTNAYSKDVDSSVPIY